MKRGRRSTAPWVALAAAILGLLGATQVSEGDLLRLGRAAWRAVQSLEEPRAPSRGASRPAGAPFSGHPRVIDGDTFDLSGIRVRMQGIDALERDQQCSRGGGGRFACGTAARDALAELIGGREVTCTPDGTLTHGRTVAVCTVPQGNGGVLDLNRAMVRSGLAFDCPRYSKGRYASAEAEAKAAREGAWAGRFTYPWSHRDRAGACGR
ncbi:thermonuclease family protein [Roseomonas sp. E05]|uniref:thermonuclease family protein n=1 Tax=Roseomonas sp. E05 TaxID=3046310 RepID=UPI0024B9EBE3|nr:thermonuclease family protein [Roseomonas sp. E05]MDJ0387981.1 thermonuclease family protein [Roseomonas sp. E05]